MKAISFRKVRTSTTDKLISNIMTERIDFLIADQNCKNALDEMNMHTSIPEWLSQYLDLYHRVSIKPEGLPRIIDFNLGKEKFEYIKMFADIYELCAGNTQGEL